MTKPELLKILGLPDAFEGFRPIPSKLHGWNGGIEILPKLIAERRPKFIIEVGAWLGLSTLVMAEALVKEQLPDSCILTIDTWLGSLEHWRDENNSLGLQNGFPTLYPRFLSNVVNYGYTNKIMPLPMPSAIGARYLAHFKLKADLIFLDGSHDEKDVWDDLNGYNHRHVAGLAGALARRKQQSGAAKRLPHAVPALPLQRRQLRLHQQNYAAPLALGDRRAILGAF